MNAIATIQRARRYDPAIADEFCRLVAEGSSLVAACELLSISPSSVTRWAQEVTVFATNYAHAKSAKLDLMADEIITIGDDLNAPSAADVQHAKLKTDNRKWLLSKLRAEVYGDKLDVTSKGEALAAPSHQVDARVQSIVMQAAMRMQAGAAAGLDDDAKSLLE